MVPPFQIRFKYEWPAEPPPMPVVEAPPSEEERLQSQLAAQLQLPDLDTSAAPPPLHQVRTYNESHMELSLYR